MSTATTIERPKKRRDVLPASLPPRGLNRSEAAAYVGISTTFFDVLVSDGRMPRPKTVGARKVWDRMALDQAFSDLPDEEERNPWDND
jgi:predicted DNA-binding transcriptional regulator AlpA